MGVFLIWAVILLLSVGNSEPLWEPLRTFHPTYLRESLFRVIVIGLAMRLALCARLPRESHSSHVLWACLSLLAACTVSCLLSPYREVSVFRSQTEAMCGGALVLVASVRLPGGMRTVGHAVIGSGVLAALLSMAAYFWAIWRHPSLWSNPGFRLMKPFGNPNFAAAYFLLPLMFCVSWVLRWWVERRRWDHPTEVSKWHAVAVHTVAAVVVGVAFVLANSQAAYIGAAAGMLFALLAVSPRGARRYILLGIVVAFLLGCAGLLCMPGFLSALKAKFIDPQSTLQVRAFLWPAAWQMFLARPLLGWGPGTFMSTVYSFLSSESGKYPYVGIGGAKSGLLSHAHNEVLERLAETGILGTCAAAILLLLILVRVFRRLDSLPPVVRVYHAGLAAGLVAVFVHSCGGVALRFWELAPLFWMGLGILENPSANGMSSPTSSENRRLPFSARFVGVAVIAVPVFWYAVVLDYQSQVNLRRGAAAERRGDFETAARLYERTLATATYPVDYLRVHFKLAICLGKAGRLPESRNAFVHLQRLAPGLDMSRLLLARIDLATGNTQEAISLLNEYEEQNPYDARLYLVRGLAYKAIGEPGKARRAFAEGLELCSRTAPVRQALESEIKSLDAQISPRATAPARDR